MSTFVINQPVCSVHGIPSTHCGCMNGAPAVNAHFRGQPVTNNSQVQNRQPLALPVVDYQTSRPAPQPLVLNGGNPQGTLSIPVINWSAFATTEAKPDAPCGCHGHDTPSVNAGQQQSAPALSIPVVDWSQYKV